MEGKIVDLGFEIISKLDSYFLMTVFGAKKSLQLTLNYCATFYLRGHP